MLVRLRRRRRPLGRGRMVTAAAAARRREVRGLRLRRRVLVAAAGVTGWEFCGGGGKQSNILFCYVMGCAARLEFHSGL